jgi:hypothetical protein
MFCFASFSGFGSFGSFGSCTHIRCTVVRSSVLSFISVWDRQRHIRINIPFFFS